jgi:hypothetical protein
MLSSTDPDRTDTSVADIKSEVAGWILVVKVGIGRPVYQPIPVTSSSCLENFYRIEIRYTLLCIYLSLISKHFSAHNGATFLKPPEVDLALLL